MKNNQILLAASLLIGALVAQAAAVADNAKDDQARMIEEVVVQGRIVRGEMKALNAQMNSKKMVNVISADGMGKLPDRNAAEAVQRIPGISIERDQGEGRFVAIRGLPSHWSSASVNGDRLPTAEEETLSRATAFDFFPTEMIEMVEVSKAVTADMEGDAMGGNVNFVTRTAPDDKLLSVTLGTGYQEKAGKSGYNANILYGDVTDDGTFGFLVNATAWVRDWATDNIEARRGDDGIGIRRLELRDYTGTRETYGFNAAAEYNPTESDKYYVRLLYGTLEDDETHYKHRYRFDKDRIELQNIHDILITEMVGYEFGGDHVFNNGAVLDWKLSSYENEFRYGDVPDSADNAYFVTRFDQTNVGFVGLEDRGTGNNYAYNQIDGGTDPAVLVSTHLPDGFQMDPSQTNLNSVELYQIFINEKDKIVTQVNWTQPFSNELELKFGLKYRDKERIARFSDEFYVWNPSAGPLPTLADFNLRNQPGRFDFFDDESASYDQDLSLVPGTSELEDFYITNRSNFGLDEGESALVSNGGALGRNFDVFEKQLAAYGMATYQYSDDLIVIAGLRLEQTKTDTEGQVFVEDVGLQDAGGSTDYVSVLPSVHLKYSLDDTTNIRAAITRTFSRPGFGTLSPGGAFSEQDNEFNSGNPEVDPTYSVNFDLMIERFYDDVGVLSAGYFYKSITDPIFQAVSVGEFNGNTGVTFLRPNNGGDAWLHGIELAISKRLTFLPSILSNLGVIANFTFMDSEMELDGRSDDAAIPRQADILYNATLYYDDGAFSTRIAYNYKDDFIEEHGSSAADDNFYAEYASLDLSASYLINDQLTVFADMNNLLNEPLIYFQGDADRITQVEYYGRRVSLGVKYNF